MKKLSKLLLVGYVLLSMTSCKDKSVEGKLLEEKNKIEKEYAEAAKEKNIIKAYAKELKAYIKSEELKQTVQNLNDVISQIKEGGIDSIKAIVNKISSLFNKLVNEEEVEIKDVLAAYGVASTLALFEDKYENDPIIELCDEFDEYIEDLVEGEDTSTKETKINLYLNAIENYTDDDYQKLFNKLTNN